MKGWIDVTFDSKQCKKELDQFGELLKAEELSESKDVLPFFKDRPQLTAFIGDVAPKVGPANRVGREFPLLGDFRADFVVGDKGRGDYCLIEFEGGRKDSLFRTVKNRSMKEWGTQFEHGFSQLVDWFCLIDDQKNTEHFKKIFGYGRLNFCGMLVVGRSAALSEAERNRLKWREEKVIVNSHWILCLTFDELYESLARRLGLRGLVSGLQ